jgi:D-lactate dehydrogenase (cytochrome)
MVDPGADASIGGMVACGASGTTAVKYGTMRENILGLECVLPDGTIAKCGTKALKSSAGYDLTSLMTGSEGTLGVITKVTVKLHPIPEHVIAAICEFDSLHEAAEAVVTMIMCSIPVERCELLDESSMDAFRRYAASSGDGNFELGAENKPTLFLEFTGSSEAAVREQVTLTESICDDFSGSNFEFKADETERKTLWKARHNLYYASLALRKGATDAVLTDACVPLSKFAEIITATAKDVKDFNLVGPCFGHAGDGNFHCILPIVEGDDDEYIAKVHKVNDNLIRRTIDVGGTCTGEHGIGYGKLKYLYRQYGEGGIKFMKEVKKGIDPNNIMNPGKVVVI